MLSKWRPQLRDGEIVTKGIELNTGEVAERKELRKMRKDNERMKMEHEYL